MTGVEDKASYAVVYLQSWVVSKPVAGTTYKNVNAEKFVVHFVVTLWRGWEIWVDHNNNNSNSNKSVSNDRGTVLPRSSSKGGETYVRL